MMRENLRPVTDACFSEPRLAEIYDALDGDRTDLELYVAIAAEVDAASVLDLGCGTGVLARRLAETDCVVVGVDPAEASIAVARAGAGGGRVRWHVGDAGTYDGPPVDLVTMTGNVAQVFVSDADWTETLRACHRALRVGGWLVFETRDPDRAAWRDWTPERTMQHVSVPGGGRVKAWCDVTEIALPLVSFRWTYIFDSDGAVLHSDSTLAFRGRDAIAGALEECGFVTCEVRDAPDRPGAEMVLLAQAR